VRSSKTMSTELWKLAAPATSLLKRPVFLVLPKRVCELYVHFERNDGRWSRFCIQFSGVEAFKCTHLTSCDTEMLKAAYGKLMGLADTPWLAEVRQTYNKRMTSAKKLQHLMICFESGPCYEFICMDYALFF
jgi:hypothetical protein